jgi:hypothetical protein
VARKPFAESEIDALNAMNACAALDQLGLEWKSDESFKPRTAIGTRRLIVYVGSLSVELLVCGAKWFDTRVRRGGTGAISLTMHLHQLQFVAAVIRLKKRSAGLPEAVGRPAGPGGRG